MEIQKLIERAKELDLRATPGPWKWDLRTHCRDVKIVTDHSGQYYVMTFERWGMQGAAPSFQVYDRYEGPVKERGSHGMRRVDTMAKSYPGKEHHKGWDDYPNHPDARFIVESRQLVPELTAAVEKLAAELEWTKGQLDKIVQKFGIYHDGMADAITKIVAMVQDGQLRMMPSPGDEIYEIDGAHGIVKHIVTDVHWVANTVAVDDAGQTWGDYYTDEEIGNAYPNRKAAEFAMDTVATMEGGL